MKATILALFTCVAICSYGQCPKMAIYASANCPAEFPGGYVKMNKWIRENTKEYPNFGEERVVTKFVVDSAGNRCDIRILKARQELIKKGKFNDSLSVLEKEAIRLLQNMPAWTPAKIGDKCSRPVNFETTHVFKFRSKNFDSE